MDSINTKNIPTAVSALQEWDHWQSATYASNTNDSKCSNVQTVHSTQSQHDEDILADYRNCFGSIWKEEYIHHLYSSLAKSSRQLDAIQQFYVSSGCPVIDISLSGGFRRGFVTEICGEAAAGKTQIVLQSLWEVCSKKFVEAPESKDLQPGSAIAVYTEGRFPANRFRQIGLARVCSFPLSSTQSKQSHTRVSAAHSRYVDKCMNRCLINECGEMEEFLQLIQVRLPALLKRAQHVQLVAIDSLAAMFHQSGTSNLQNATTRAAALWFIAHQLRILARQYNIAIIVTNHIVASQLDTTDVSNQETLIPGSSSLLVEASSRMPLETSKPSLGVVWTHAIHARIRLYKKPIPYPIPSDQMRNGRLFRSWTINQILGTSTIPSSTQSKRRRITNVQTLSSNDVHETSHSTLTIGMQAEQLQTHTTNSGQDNVYQTSYLCLLPAMPMPDNSLSAMDCREMLLEFSPCQPSRRCLYDVTVEGVLGVQSVEL